MDTAIVQLIDLSVKILQSVADQPNVLISPISAIAALSMTQHGAAGDTRAQIDEVLGSAKKITDVLTAMFRSNSSEVRFANAVCVPEEASVNIRACPGVDFLQIPPGADACRIINKWISRKTDGRIPCITDRSPQKSNLHLLSALAFKAEWTIKYASDDVYPEIFTSASGRKTETVFLHSDDEIYLRDTSAHGFCKPYLGGRYAFVALIPLGISLQEYIRNLTERRLTKILKSRRDGRIKASVPRFICECETDMSDMFMQMGITDAFTPGTADFSRLAQCTNPLWIGVFTQQTYIDLNECGTEAIAASDLLLAMGNEKKAEVRLDRPFLYMIMDRQMNLPLFMGTVTDIEQMKGN